VPGHAAIRVDDDLAARQAGIALRTTDHEQAGWIDERPVRRRIERELVEYGLDHMDFHRLPHVRQRHVPRVLRRHDDGVDRLGHVAFVRDRDLGLAVRPQSFDNSVPTYFGQALREPMRDRDRQRHQ
jgi:hypothetical protein